MTTKEEISAEIRRIRKAKGWTQTQLEVHSGVSRRIIIRVEQGEQTTDVSTLIKLLNALGKKITFEDI